MGSGFLKKKKQARMMQEQFSQMQSELSDRLDKIEVTGSSGGGLVEVILTGASEMKDIRIKPDCVDKDDIEGLCVLIKAAYKDACEKLKAVTEPSNFAGMPDISSMLQF